MSSLPSGLVVTVLSLQIVNSVVNGTYQYQLQISQDGMNNLKQHFQPLLDQMIKSQIIAPIHSHDFDTHSIEIQSFHYDEISIKLDETSQTINLCINNFNLELKEFDFSAHKRVTFVKVTCGGSLRPRFDNWSFHFQIRIHNTDSCELALDLDEASIQITRGNVDLHKHFNQGVCKAVFDVFDFLFDVEADIINQQINKIPHMVRDAMQRKLDKILPQTQRIQYYTNDIYTSNIEAADEHDIIGICYKEADILDDKLIIAVDFMFDALRLNMTRHNAAALSDIHGIDEGYEKEDDLSGFWILFGLCSGSFLCGGCCVCVGCFMCKKCGCMFANDRHRYEYQK